MTDNYYLQQAVDLINESEEILVTTHTKPDGDALGCLVAICETLGALGKKVKPLLLSPAPEWYRFLLTENVPVLDEDFKLDELNAGRFGEFDLVMILDTNSPGQLPKFRDYLKQNKKPVLVIDHHRTADGLGAVELVEADAAATALVVLELLDYAGWEITEKIAEALFIAIATDTGWFQFNNTNGRVFSTCAELIDMGVKPTELYHKLYENFSQSRFMLMTAMLDTLKLHLSGRFASMYITRHDFEKTGATYADSENLINECRRINTVDTTALFIELGDGRIRCSLRSKGAVDVGEIAAVFGGGGHAMAAGTFVPGPIEKSQNLIFKEVSKRFSV
ncbi:MAG: bifunctional oligoribonuclease/PAP phosphatase NrnA [Sedimentisphaerales bacterium]|nr:bifunctional oligoribonuclease/PAP phosphatase NrnA [Sedimentisphaerales bacterium]